MAKIEVTPDPRKLTIRDPETGDVLKETTITFDKGCGVKVNGITSAYCDGKGKPVNVIRAGLAAIADEIKEAVEEHYQAEAPKVGIATGVGSGD